MEDLRPPPPNPTQPTQPNPPKASHFGSPTRPLFSDSRVFHRYTRHSKELDCIFIKQSRDLSLGFNSLLNLHVQISYENHKRISLFSSAERSFNANTSPLQERWGHRCSVSTKITCLQGRNSARPASILPCPLPTTKSSSPQVDQSIGGGQIPVQGIHTNPNIYYGIERVNHGASSIKYDAELSCPNLSSSTTESSFHRSTTRNSLNIQPYPKDSTTSPKICSTMTSTGVNSFQSSTSPLQKRGSTSTYQRSLICSSNDDGFVRTRGVGTSLRSLRLPVRTLSLSSPLEPA